MNNIRISKLNKAYQDIVKKDTWDKGLPMIYRDKNGDVIKHWPDGKIEKSTDKKKI